ncbi:hypothetical protein WICPIJ_005105 [Wickerhamomyces pijperi]|uniref:Uncharacterized protein n=1 Tax=Wickerhamomyces pijperi TaxID=599730 RepID=A0A9P8Q6K7_WICPI|nr:hypothetical protein WICPIJ_005105 [Wickerhamomyces pijperi]
MTAEMLISLAPWEIISMLMPDSAKVENIVEATPMYCFICLPINETMDMFLVTSTVPNLFKSKTASLKSLLEFSSSLCCKAMETWTSDCLLVGVDVQDDDIMLSSDGSGSLLLVEDGRWDLLERLRRMWWSLTAFGGDVIWVDDGTITAWVFNILDSDWDLSLDDLFHGEWMDDFTTILPSKEERSAALKSLDVVPSDLVFDDLAEQTTATLDFWEYGFTISSQMLLKNLPTEVPPNFWTTQRFLELSCANETVDII